MKKGVGIALSFTGIIILLGTIIYQAVTESTALYMIPIGLLLTFFGAFYMKKAAKSKEK